MDIFEKDKEYIVNSYRRLPIHLTNGKGSLVYDEDGKSYIDLGSGIGVNVFGIADDQWIKAVTSQLNLIQHSSNLYYTDPCVNLAKLLIAKSGMKKVFFCNSGAEANENGIKAVRKYAAQKKGSEYYTIITLLNSFHGRTLTNLAATGQDVFHRLYQPLTPGFIHVPPDDIDALSKAIKEHKVAGFMMECVQGEGGVCPLSLDYVKKAACLCEENDIVLMCDEVQCGNGRTGYYYAFMHYGINPDVVTTAKGVGGGLPLGVCMLGEKLKDIFSYGDVGSTYGGNPVCCAGGVSIMSRIDEALLLDVRKKGSYLFKKLKSLKGIEEVSGLGLMIGFKAKKPTSDIINELMKNGVLVLSAKDKVRILPALNIPMELLEEATEKIIAVCE